MEESGEDVVRLPSRTRSAAGPRRPSGCASGVNWVRVTPSSGGPKQRRRQVCRARSRSARSGLLGTRMGRMGPGDSIPKALASSYARAMAKKREVVPKVGPSGHENWCAANRSEPSRGAHEVTLYTDAWIVGEVTSGCGPYTLLNTVALPQDEQARPRVILRYEWHLATDTRPQITATDDSRYLGGGPADELSALLSLALGARFQAGPLSRTFEPGKDPRGRPVGWEVRPTPQLSPRAIPPIMPSLTGERTLTPSTLAGYDLLPPEDAIALARAARAYQNAVWVAEAEPNLAWLLLVSALETAATRWRSAEGSPVDVLRAVKPDWVALLETGGSSLLESMATQLVPLVGATRRFRDFVLEHLPAPPAERPAEAWARLDWDEAKMRKTMDRVYELRSYALHGGKPFPVPMCSPPHPSFKPAIEVPIGLATSSQNAVWMSKDTPLLLHMFEYIARGALLHWRDRMITRAREKASALSNGEGAGDNVVPPNDQPTGVGS
jgi:hypothetical protein